MIPCKIVLLCKSQDGFLYDRDLRHKRVKCFVESENLSDFPNVSV